MVADKSRSPCRHSTVDVVASTFAKTIAPVIEPTSATATRVFIDTVLINKLGTSSTKTMPSTKRGIGDSGAPELHMP
jgi:hypothetical protein